MAWLESGDMAQVINKIIQPWTVALNPQSLHIALLHAVNWEIFVSQFSCLLVIRFCTR